MADFDNLIIKDEQYDQYDQYKQMCDNNCGQMLTINTHINCISNRKTGEEMTVCSNCWEDENWSDDWYDADDELYKKVNVVKNIQSKKDI